MARPCGWLPSCCSSCSDGGSHACSRRDSLGPFYTTLVSGADRILIPNSVLLQLAVVPLREPERVEMRARFGADITPAEVQELLTGALTVPTRYPPDITLEELDGDQIVVRISATPERPADGSRLASEVLAAIRQAQPNRVAT